ncbi:MAG: hypothetical protein KIH89_000840 [Candidatus Shapirobacteria bacterium]|nr:hypothetical protein [Candidatus Shapirobacteria bacterium]
MKKKSALVFGFGLMVLLSVGTGIVIGQTSGELPRVTTACENKAGLIQGFDDGFSILKKCSKGSRQVVLGEKSTMNGDVSVEGKIAFVDRNYVLLDDGTVWNYEFGDGGDVAGWFEATNLRITDLNVSDIVDWSSYSFVTKQGNLFIKHNNGWSEVDTSTL